MNVYRPVALVLALLCILPILAAELDRADSTERAERARLARERADTVRADTGYSTIGGVAKPHGRTPNGRTLYEWDVRPIMDSLGTCDSEKECRSKLDEMCSDAGHGGLKEGEGKITVHADDSRNCAGKCKLNGAWAFVDCQPQQPSPQPEPEPEPDPEEGE